MIAYVQAIPARQDYIEQVISPRLLSGGLVTAIIPIVDHDGRGPLWNALRVWKKVAASGETAFIIQDDSIPHRQFAECARDIIAHVENGTMHAVSLFAAPRKRYDEIAAQNCNFIETYDFLGLPGTIMTPTFASGLVDYAATSTEPKHDDVVVNNYIRASGIPIWTAIPSIVQHDLNVRSSMRHPKSPAGIARRSRLWWKEIPSGWFADIRSKKYGRPKP